MIEIKNIHKSYGSLEVLKGIDAVIQQGEIVSIVGASGAGKTTLLQIVGTLDKPDCGEILYDGRRVDNLPDREMARFRNGNIGFVFQFYNLVQNLTVKENVELATQICKEPLDIVKTIEAVGLSDRIGNFPSQLSGGEQQRVAIARALAKNPKMLLCDEPTGALDINTGKNILKLLSDMCRKNGITVVVITHNQAISAMGDKVIKIKNGIVDSVVINDNPVSVDEIDW